ncbi:MAG: DUF4956 domain-containing protein [Chitinophagales bacterium]|nr:DUF4956 domain-containing protein [Chitinophagales bacterium]
MIELNTLLLDAIRIFDIKLFDVDFYELILRLGLNLTVAYSIIHFIYQPTRKDSEYIFTFMVFSPLIFFVCNLFSNAELDIGFAFGLFAVFSILRYRTAQIQVKEMTYMFIVIAVAVINALATKKISYAELLFTNAFIIFITYVLERYLANSGVTTQTIRYEVIENIKPENEALLLEDLQKRIGKPIIRFDILEVDYIRDSARLRVVHER